MRTDILQIIKEYLKYYCGEKERISKLIDFIEKSRKNDKDIYDSKNIDGHITASGLIYAKKEQKFLLLKHKKAKRWLQPGGHSEKEDKTILDTAKREIFEETGLKDLQLVSFFENKEIPFDRDTHYIPMNSKKDMPAHYHHDFRFLFMIDSIKDIKICNTESDGYKWVNINEIKENEDFRILIEKISNKIDFKAV